MRGDEEPCRSKRALQLTGANLLGRFDFDVAPAAASRHGSLEEGDFVSRAAFEAPTSLATPTCSDQGRYFVLTG